MIRALFRKNPAAEAADMLYLAVAGAARNPALFAACGVPDTVEGRFEALAAHVFLVARRLEAAGTDGAPLAQAFIDRFFADLDNAVRAIGIGDLSVGKKVKAYAKAFYGRVEAYTAGLASADPEVLQSAVRRNLLGADAAPRAEGEKLARYLAASDQRLSAMSLEVVMAGVSLFETEVLS